MEENKVMETNDVFDTEIDDVTTTRSGNGLGKIALVVGSAAAIGVAVWLKTKKRREERKIEKLRKKGYVIIDPNDVCDTEVINVEETKED